LFNYEIVCIFAFDYKRIIVMYRRSSKSSQKDLFSSVDSLLQGKALKEYMDPLKWHNQFRVQFTERINEDLFRPLFHEDFGAPNASIRLLIGMMILKEGQGWSDCQLFDQCKYNLLVRSALGLLNLSDPIPSLSTYYLLRSRIVCHENETYENLIETAFAQVTKSQAIEFQVNGSRIRMDSKLIGSNIAWYSRYELIHETVRMAYLSAKSQIDRLLTESQVSLLGRMVEESGEKVTYHNTCSELETKLFQLGQVIYSIINGLDDRSSTSLQTLHRVFNEHYQVVKDEVHVRPKQEISASSVQSPHDTDCQYRQKDDRKVKGYSINVTETCDPACLSADGSADKSADKSADGSANRTNTLNLVTNVLIDTAGAVDGDFFQTAVEVTKEIVTGKVETVNADGAYHSPENQAYCKENEIELIVGAIQGKPSRYDLSLNENGNLVVTDLKTNTLIDARKIKSRKEGDDPNRAILNEKNRYRYFSQKDIDTCLLRKQIAVRSPEELNIRNNVEATIFQLGYRYPNAKSRYRGLIKHKMWANLRCFWINIVRIANFIAGNGPDYAKKLVNRWILPCFDVINEKTGVFQSRLLHFFEELNCPLLLFLGRQTTLPVFYEKSANGMLLKK